MAEFINEKDSLNDGRKKLNKAIEHANDAKSISEQADNKATQALSNSESTQEQLNQVVIDGDSSVEAAQARIDEKGQPHDTLKDRIDDGFTKVNTQLADTVLGINNNTITPIYDNEGNLVRVEEKKDEVIVRSVDLAFDGGELVEVIETISESTVKSTLNYTAGILTNIEKEVM